MLQKRKAHSLGVKESKFFQTRSSQVMVHPDFIQVGTGDSVSFTEEPQSAILLYKN